MKNQNASSSKVVATRLPMIDYIAVLEKATFLNLSISEFITLKIFSENKGAEELLTQIQTLQARELTLRDNCADKSNTIKIMEEKISDLEAMIKKCIKDYRQGFNKSEVEKLKNDYIQYIRKRARIRIAILKNEALELYH